MNKGVTFFVGISIFILSSCGSYTKKAPPVSIYEKFNFEAEITENEELVNIEIVNAAFPISFVWYKEFERTFIKVNHRFQLIDMAWTLDDGLNPEIEKVSLFTNKDDYFILFPTYTEEFPSFGLIAISKNRIIKDLGFHTYSFTDFEKAKNEMLNGNYLLGEVSDSVRVLLDSTPKLMLSHRYSSEESEDPISEKEKTMLEALLSNEITDLSENNEDVTIVESYSFDLDNDGVLDKINVIQEDEVLDDFDREHFGLTVEILKGEGDRFNDWAENDFIFDVQSTCVCEGFDQVYFENGVLKISQQGCYDYTFLVNSSAAFRVIDGEIYLMEYKENYFNKSDHDQSPPSKTWTEKDFGKVKFENVSEEFLIDLRLR